jgi:hypothetical protein
MSFDPYSYVNEVARIIGSGSLDGHLVVIHEAIHARQDEFARRDTAHREPIRPLDLVEVLLRSGAPYRLRGIVGIVSKVNEATVRIVADPDPDSRRSVAWRSSALTPYQKLMGFNVRKEYIRHVAR